MISEGLPTPTGPIAQVMKVPTGILLIELSDILFELRWWILAAIVLVLADLWFGLRVSRKNDVEIRFSRAWRRTFNKFVDYILYVVLGTTLAMAAGPSLEVNPVQIASIILIFCYAFEIDSIYSHVCQLHGVKKKISVFKVLWLMLTLRFNELRKLDSTNSTKEVDNLQPIEKDNNEQEQDSI